MTMPAGKYWIGDLCYVLHSEWHEVCDLTISNDESLDGEFNLKDGRRFAIFGTAYGDGSYKDQVGKEYGVDAGIIGCILLDSIDLTNKDNDLELGHIYDFDHSFQPYSSEGKIHFSHLTIDTNPEDEDEDEYGEDDYSDYYPEYHQEDEEEE